MSRRFLQVDAFTTTPLQGNACAVVLDADGLDDATMQAIAREMNLSETAFVVRTENADVGARYFTPAEEIPLAGHPTIATLHALVEEGRLDSAAGRTVTLELRAGLIPVDLDPRPGGGVMVTMSQLAPEFLDTHEAADVAPAFGLVPADFVDGVPIQTVSTGTPQLMMAVRSHAALERARVDHAAYTALRESAGFFSPHLFCTTGVTEAGDTFARHFGVAPDTPEDPFTGSATGGMAAFLWRYRLIERPSFVAEQGHWMGRPGTARVEVVGPPEDIQTVRVAGEAVTVVRGELDL
ncbi:MAG: PhzF family phenazine biosynthesis protein [Gemmatimonadota bacterium]|nr:PhzF family phenazine biosynthesis protein [Gemmatimonadota bacterium]